MIGFGTLINVAAVVAGGIAGIGGAKFMRDEYRETLEKVCVISVLFIGIAGAMEKMLSVSGGKIEAGCSMLITLCLVIGAFIGEVINIEGGFEKFGSWLKIKTKSTGDTRFVDAFVTASLTVSIGAMAIVGSIRDGINGDWSVLAAKSVLDFIIILVMSCSLGKGCIFSALPILAFEGGITLFAVFIKPFMTQTALDYISLIGSILIFCVGLNLVWGKKIRVANLLPSILLAFAAAYLI